MAFESDASVADDLRASDFVVVDISRQNPNVYYEIGFAHALRKTTILLKNAESGGSIPSDLAGFQFIVYDSDNLRSLVDHVKRAAAHYTADPEDESRVVLCAVS